MEVLMTQVWNGMHRSKKRIVEAHEIAAIHQENYPKAQEALEDIETRTKKKAEQPELTKDNIFIYF